MQKQIQTETPWLVADIEAPDPDFISRFTDLASGDRRAHDRRVTQKK